MTVVLKVHEIGLDTIKEKVKPLFDQMDRLEEGKLPLATKAGRWLAIAKRRCKTHGPTWETWVLINFTHSKQMADAYIRFHRHRSEIEAEQKRRKDKNEKPLNIGEAIKFLAKKHPNATAQRTGTAQKPMPKTYNFDAGEKKRLEVCLANHNLQIQAQPFADLLARLGVNVKRLVGNDGGIAILNKQLTDEAITAWLNTFVFHVQGWKEICREWGFEDWQDVSLADFAAEGQAGVYRWEYDWWGQADKNPPDGFGSIIDGIEGDYAYFVANDADLSEIAKRAADFIAANDFAEHELQEGIPDKIKARLADLDLAAVPTANVGEIGMFNPPDAEPPVETRDEQAPKPSRRRRSAEPPLG